MMAMQQQFICLMFQQNKILSNQELNIFFES